jgi:hypothetical protein
MKDQTKTPRSFVKMEAARRLMDQGRCQESLALALDALLQELDHLRTSLSALRTLTRPEAPAAPAREEPPPSEPYWLPAVKPRVLH